MELAHLRFQNGQALGHVEPLVEVVDFGCQSFDNPVDLGGQTFVNPSSIFVLSFSSKASILTLTALISPAISLSRGRRTLSSQPGIFSVIHHLQRLTFPINLTPTVVEICEGGAFNIRRMESVSEAS